MLKRTIFFGEAYHLYTEYEQLKVVCKKSGELKSLPIADLGFVVFENPQITFTQSVIRILAKNNTAVIFCDEKHHPSSMLLHLDTNYVQTERFVNQIKASEPLKKGLWKQTVKAKVNNQAALLDGLEKEGGESLRQMAKKVLSGDVNNQEAVAAKKYWSKLFGEQFGRDRNGDTPNPALNYGYAILRAAVARALSGSGLLPTLGIHHRNKYNSFCLADDIMEPYRPFVDRLVYQLNSQNYELSDLGKKEKQALLEVLTIDTKMDGELSPLMVAVRRTCASLNACFSGIEKRIIYPQMD